MVDAARAGDGELPEAIAELAAEQILAADPAERGAVERALAAAHPAHATALCRLARELAGAEALLAAGFRGAAPAEPDSIGPYRVVRSLGAGAFGLVFLCEQDVPIQRRVAVKVLRPGAGDDQTIARFELERQLLAQLGHPAIAHVLDAGTLPDGRPYFVMEYVDGLPIRTYCDERQLSVDARLRLFLELCRGVEHAHRRGIVHRDLKPANVLVVESESGPLPKIIDFGIAKALRTRAAEPRIDTETGRVVGTPGYMSPEQAAGQAYDVDARADVYALGVMLYELLTGELPWGRRSEPTDAEPQRPSARVGARPLALRLRGDLDCIALKALARERERRYASAGELAADLERHLRGEPIAARPTHLGLRATRLVRRHRAVLAGALALLAIALGTWSSMHYWAEARARASQVDDVEQRLSARAAQADARADRALEQATLAVEKLVARANDASVRRSAENDAVRQALAQDALGFYEQWLAERPRESRLRAGRCRALASLSSVHWQLGQVADAGRTAAEAVAEAEELFAGSPEDLDMRGLLADALRRHGRALALAQQSDEARSAFERAVEHLEHCESAAPGRQALSLSSAYRELGSMDEELERSADALDAVRRSVAVLERHIASGRASPEAHTDIAIARESLVRQLLGSGLVEEAAAVAAAARAGLPAVTLDVHRVTGRVHSASARLAVAQRDWPAAIEQSALAAAADERWYESEPNRFVPGGVLLDDLSDLAGLYGKVADWPSADRALRRAIEVADAMVARVPDDLGRRVRLEGTLHDAAFQLYDRLRHPDLEQAQAWIERALETNAEIARRGGVPHRARDQLLTARALIAEARGTATEEQWEEVAAALTADLDIATPKHEFDFAGWHGVALSRLRRGKLEEAAAALAQAERWVGDPPRLASQACDVAWTRSRLALERSDVDAALAAAERILVVRPTWMGRWRAADCNFAAYRRLVEEAAGSEPRAAELRDTAARLYRQVIEAIADDARANPDDPWYVVPWGFASVRLAELEMLSDRPDEAGALLDAALPALERIAPLAHRDVWQAEAFERATALRAAL